MQKIPLTTKIQNAYRMLRKQGFSPLLYKTYRFIYHKTQNLIRKIGLYVGKNPGKELREAAKEYGHKKTHHLTFSIIIPVLGQHDLAQFCINKIVKHHSEPIEIVVIDNGGDFRPETSHLPADIKVKVICPPEGNISVYPCFDVGMKNTEGDIILFIHSDIVVDEDNFDVLLKYLFARDPKLGVVGFVGSDEINKTGGRGWGTTSNFAARTYRYKDKKWTGTDAKVHGERFDGLTEAILLDGCAIAFPRKVWNEIGYRPNFPINHYYDRLICLQAIEKGYTVAVLGLACEHLSGQTSTDEKIYADSAKKWCQEHNIPPVMDTNGNISWNMSIWTAAREATLKEWKDDKHFIPRRISWKI